MAIRTELIEIEPILEKIGIDILDIENEIFSFDNKIKSVNFSTTKFISRLQDCILHFRNARNRLRNFLQPSENKYIDLDILNKMDEDIGRLDDDINKKEKAIIEKVDTLDFKEISEKRNIKINPLKNLLIEAMNSIVINSIVNSSYRFDNTKKEKGIKKETVKKEVKKGEKNIIVEEVKETEIDIPKDIHLYKFLLFQEMQPASQSVGGFTRQETKSFPKNITLYNPNPISKKTPQKKELESDEIEEEESLLFEDEEEDDELF